MTGVMTTDVVEVAESGPRFAVTLPAGELVRAVRNVQPFAGSDVTLPVLMCVRVTLSESGSLTLVATDRYMMGRTVVEVSEHLHASHSGAGAVTLPADCVKTLAAVKATRHWELVTLTVAADGAVTLALPDTRVMSWSTMDAYEYPNIERLISSWQPAESAPASIGLNAEHIARIAKIRDDGGGKHAPTLVITYVADHSDGRPRNAVLFTCGPVSGGFMLVRVDA